MARSISEVSTTESVTRRKASKSRPPRLLSRSRPAAAAASKQNLSGAGGNFLYQPHYVSGLIALVGYLLYLAFYKTTDISQSPVYRYKILMKLNSFIN